MPAIIGILARLGVVLKSISWITVVSTIIGAALFMGVVPFFMKQQSIDVNAAIKRSTSPITIIGLLGFSTIVYLILREAKRK